MLVENAEAMSGAIGPHQARESHIGTVARADKNEPMRIQNARKTAKVITPVVNG